MSGNKPIYYWDTNIYLAWLNKEEETKEFHPHIAEILNKNFTLENKIITSVLTLTEVLAYNFGDLEKENRFRRMFNQHSHVLLEVTQPVAEKARELRHYYQENPIDGRKLLVPDAIHLATAIVYRATEVNSFDEGKKKGIDDDHVKVKTISMLQLNGNVAGEPMRICKPHVVSVGVLGPPIKLVTPELFDRAKEA